MQAVAPDRASQSQSTPARQYDVDWLRVIATFAVFLFHCSQFFNDWGWHVKNIPPNFWVSGFSLLLVQWIMPFFFIISGLSAGYSLGRRSAGAFFQERSARLLPPLALGIFLLSPHQVWIERVTQQGFQGSLLDFLPHYFDGMYGFGGNFAWMGLHLWYLLLLFLFSLLTYPLFRAVSSPVELRSPAWLLVLPLLPMLLQFFPDPRTPWGTTAMGGYNPLIYLTLFVYGYLFFRSTAFKELIRRFGGWALAGSLLTQVAFTYLEATGGVDYGMTVAWALFAILRISNLWCWALGLFYLGDRYLRANSPKLQYWSGALMPIYILHQPIIVLAGYLVRGLPWGLGLKMLVLVGGCFAVIMAIYQWLVRPLRAMRWLFGMK